MPTGVDVDGVLAAAEEIVKPMITRLPVADRASIVQGRFGVYNSFLLHAERAAIATASRRTRSCAGWARPATWVARRT